MKLYLIPSIIQTPEEEYGGAILLRNLAACAADLHPQLAYQAEGWAREIEEELQRQLSVKWDLSAFDPQPVEGELTRRMAFYAYRSMKIDGACHVTADFRRAIELAKGKPFLEVPSGQIFRATMIVGNCRIHREIEASEEEGDARSSPD